MMYVLNSPRGDEIAQVVCVLYQGRRPIFNDTYPCHRYLGDSSTHKDKEESFIGPQEFVVGYSKAPEQLQSSARPTCHCHTMTSTGREPATIRIAAYRSSPHYATGDA